MKFLDLTLPSPEENVALDEALLEICEAGPDGEALRFWEPQNYFVVLGLSNQVKTETRWQNCAEARLPVIRRSSGGGTVLQGPGCLNYALALRIDRDPALGQIISTNRYILGKHAEALQKLLGLSVSFRGQSDLALGEKKFSGNAQRRKRRAILFHGTFLTGMDFKQMERFLAFPSRQPDYRRARSHENFLANLPVSAGQIKKALSRLWGANGKTPSAPLELSKELVLSRYSRDTWNFKR